jgi:hypothetical protein
MKKEKKKNNNNNKQPQQYQHRCWNNYKDNALGS